MRFLVIFALMLAPLSVQAGCGGCGYSNSCRAPRICKPWVVLGIATAVIVVVVLQNNTGGQVHTVPSSSIPLT